MQVSILISTAVRRVLLLALLLLPVLPGCITNPAVTGPFPRFSEYDGRQVRTVSFTGDLQIPRDTLPESILTHAPRCRIPRLPLIGCIPGSTVFEFDRVELARDVARIQLLYRDFGYYGTRVIPTVDAEDEKWVSVRFSIAPGDRVYLRDLAVEGIGEVMDSTRLRARLPLKEGEPFSRNAFLSSADTIRASLIRRGYAYADVLRNYAIDTIADVAEAQYEAIPGPLVRVDTIIVLGGERLGRATVMKTLAFRQGEVLQAPELAISQRNLYELPFVQLASVQLAPDSLQVNPDSSRATVVVRVVEAAKYALDVAPGFGTVDCLRGEVRGVNRNFRGGARRLELTASATRVGAAEPTGFATGAGCAADPLSDSIGIGYRLAADFEQPRLFGTRTRLLANVHAERQAQLGAFVRQSIGAQVAVNRAVRERAQVTATADVGYGSTRAEPVTFCVYLRVCDTAALANLQKNRWSNSLAVGARLDRTGTRDGTIAGWNAQGNVHWASALLGSDDEYLSVLGQVAGYRPIGGGRVLAGRLQAGTFLDAGYIPPQRRFYAGGPTTVRGYEWNQLGPVIAVDTLAREPTPGEEPRVPCDSVHVTRACDPATVPIGGTQMVVGTVELRLPSPWFTEFLRFGVFMDVGQVWAPNTQVEVATGSLRFTPGAGLRFITPVGPFRVDVAYNGYPPRSDIPLYLVTPESLELIGEYDEDSPTIWDRLVLQLAVGQAF